MKLARYVGGGQIQILDEPVPACPPGGLLVKTEASGLCSGELMDWYMDKKIPHVLGHEVAGIVQESEDDRFAVGARVFAHHHAPCMQCEMCHKRLYVHCPKWKRTKLDPGGMAEYFAVARENLTDTHRVDDLRAVDAALIEPLACVVKSLRTGGVGTSHVPAAPARVAVIGLGVMGLMHALVIGQTRANPNEPEQNLAVSGRDLNASGGTLTLPSPAEQERVLGDSHAAGKLEGVGRDLDASGDTLTLPSPAEQERVLGGDSPAVGGELEGDGMDLGIPGDPLTLPSPAEQERVSCVGYELSPARASHARSLGIRVRHPDDAEQADIVFVCPGTKAAFDLAVRTVAPGGSIVLFAPMPPGAETLVDLNRLYFLDASIRTSYSCGPRDTEAAITLLRQKRVQAEQVVSHFIGIDDLPEAYLAMKRGEILKPMVMFQ